MSQELLLVWMESYKNVSIWGMTRSLSSSLVMLSIFAVPLLALSVVSARAPTTRSASQVSAAWYAGWASPDLSSLKAIDLKKYNTLYYSFATTTSDISTLSLDASNGNLLPQFVSDAHSNGVEAHICVGGYTGSAYFSDHVSTSTNRQAFANTVVDFVAKYKLDGVQFSWEYPDDPGAGCNTHNQDDMANYLLFLQELRQSLKSTTISLAVPLNTFNDASGNPASDVSGFSKAVDYVALMNWDVFSSSTSATVGPNAPLNDTCAAPRDHLGSAVSGVKAWSNAGMPAEQIVLGMAAYGHTYDVLPSNAFLSGTKDLNTQATIVKPSSKRAGTCDFATLTPDDTPTFSELVADGTLNKQGLHAAGIYYAWNNCSETPFVYNQTAQVMVSYDDVSSISAKGKYVKDAGLRGFAIWHASGDYNNLLLNAISNAA